MYTGSPDPNPDRIYPLKAPSQTGRRISVIIFITCFLLIALLKQNAVFVLPLFFARSRFYTHHDLDRPRQSRNCPGIRTEDL